jgi:hypothetical protein
VFLSDKGIDKKLGYLKSICDLDNPERITYLLRFKHKKLHEWIQLLRVKTSNTEINQIH